jgi:hypothetical protein
MVTSGSGGLAPPFLMTALDGGEWSTSCAGCFTGRERAPATNWMGGWVGLRVGLDAMEKKKMLPLAGIEFRPFNP